MNYRDEMERFKAEPGSGMTSELFKEYCLAIANMQGYTPQVDRPRVEVVFYCDRCQMMVRTGMSLAGLPHKAIRNKCGGRWVTWVEGAEARVDQKVESSPTPSIEDYEIDDS